MDEFLNKKYWRVFPTYISFDISQLSDPWFLIKEYRNSGSTSGEALNFSTFTNSFDALDYMTGVKKKKFSSRSKKVMAFGTEQEDNARKHYENITNSEVIESGFCIYRNDYRIGVSVDGIVKSYNNEETNDGIVEIKSPMEMYKPLIDKINGINKKSKDERIPDEWGHIWPTHYCQMQLGMEVLDKKWCDYIVYSPPNEEDSTSLCYTERIPRNYIFWENIMKPGLTMFMDKVDEKIAFLNDKDDVNRSRWPSSDFFDQLIN